MLRRETTTGTRDHFGFHQACNRDSLLDDDWRRRRAAGASTSQRLEALGELLYRATIGGAVSP
jgi:hypothetical protein